MEFLYLSRKNVEDLGITMKEVLKVVEHGFRLKGLSKTEMPPKPGVHPRPNAFIHAMPAYVKEVEAAGIKWVSGYPTNTEKGLPYITGLLILNNPATGIPIAVMDCAWITAMRTGASVGISAKYLARQGSSVAAMLGCGVQARTSLRALVEILPELSKFAVMISILRPAGAL
jgi:ornithine cyclodeaminase/alanine dehydrogenase-like protein (mu-crystallin family)